VGTRGKERSAKLAEVELIAKALVRARDAQNFA
jgi:hypothetical protein